MSLSKTTVIGRLTKDPDVREVQVGGQPQKVANFSVACDRDFGEGTDFYDVVVWRKLAENVERFLGKGRLVYVEGRMQKRTYTAKTPEGHEYPRDVWEINADKVQFLDRGDNSGQAQGGQQQGGYQQQQQGGYQQQQQQQPQYQQQPYGGNAPF
jgi:single-strand DNA-binding protein